MERGKGGCGEGKRGDAMRRFVEIQDHYRSWEKPAHSQTLHVQYVWDEEAESEREFNQKSNTEFKRLKRYIELQDDVISTLNRLLSIVARQDYEFVVTREAEDLLKRIEKP
jgi:hypothetical protein